MDPDLTVTSKVPSTPSSQTVLTSDKENDNGRDEQKEGQDEENHKDVSGDDSDDYGNGDTDVDGDDDCYAIAADGEKNGNDGHFEEQEQVGIHVQDGLPSEMFISSSTFTNFLTFQLSPFVAPPITFGGSHLVSAQLMT